MTKKERALLLAIDMLVDEMKKNEAESAGMYDLLSGQLRDFEYGQMKATQMWREKLEYLARTAHKEFG